MYIIEESEGCERDVEDRQFDRMDTVYTGAGRKMLNGTQDRFRNFGNCGIPWNMAGIQEFVLHLSDRTFNADCSTYFRRQVGESSVLNSAKLPYYVPTNRPHIL
jgi:hypothetical protein